MKPAKTKRRKGKTAVGVFTWKSLHAKPTLVCFFWLQAAWVRVPGHSSLTTATDKSYCGNKNGAEQPLGSRCLWQESAFDRRERSTGNKWYPTNNTTENVLRIRSHTHWSSEVKRKELAFPGGCRHLGWQKCSFSASKWFSCWCSRVSRRHFEAFSDSSVFWASGTCFPYFVISKSNPQLTM